MVIMDHKNLGYFKQPQNLSCQQARWWLFLQEYDIRWGVERGINMGPADALSRKDEIETSDDNWEITLLGGKDQYFHVCTIDAALAKKISSSSKEDPIVTKALAAMNNDSSKPWIPQTTAANWKFVDNSLYFKHCLYVPEPAHHDLVKSLHKSPAVAVQSGIGEEGAGVRVWSGGSRSQGLEWRRRRGQGAACVGSKRPSHCFSLPLWQVHLVTRVRFICVDRMTTTHHFLILLLLPLWYPHHFHRLSTHLHAVGARGYLCSQNHFPSIFRIPPVVAQDPIVSCVNPMSIQDLTIHTRLVPP